MPIVSGFMIRGLRANEPAKLMFKWNNGLRLLLNLERVSANEERPWDFLKRNSLTTPGLIAPTWERWNVAKGMLPSGFFAICLLRWTVTWGFFLLGCLKETSERKKASARALEHRVPVEG